MLCRDNDDENRTRWDSKSGSRGKSRSTNAIDSNGTGATRGGRESDRLDQ